MKKVVPETTTDQASPKFNMGNLFRKDLPRYFLLIATVIVALVFWGLQPKFLTFENLGSIFCASSLMATMAIAVVVALASGEMNFAVGAQATIAAVVCGVLMNIPGMPYIVAVVAGLVVAMIVGALGIGLTLKIGVPSFIATLAVSSLATGFIKLLTGNKTYFSTKWGADFAFLGQGYIGKIPMLVIIFFLIVGISWFFIDYTKLGRHIFAVGTNKNACRQVGINNKKIKFIAFMISSALAGLSGILSASRNMTIPMTLGSGMMMNAFAIAMLGATFLRPGRFSIQGTAVATLLTIILQNGIFSTGTEYAARYIFQGAIFLIAVGFIALTRKEGLPGVKFS